MKDNKGQDMNLNDNIDRQHKTISYSYQPERLNPETHYEEFFAPPWDMTKHPEKTEGWIEFQRAMKKDPSYYSVK
jgi:hypothetical protein